MPKLFIVGGSDARISAALRARELAPEWQVTVAVADVIPVSAFAVFPIIWARKSLRRTTLHIAQATDIYHMGVELLLDHRIELTDPAPKAGGRLFIPPWPALNCASISGRPEIRRARQFGCALRLSGKVRWSFLRLA